MWIFGYGSIIWKQGFEFVEQRGGHIRGFARRFYQGSTDHRGVPGSPGRVVTLLSPSDLAGISNVSPSSDELMTWGMAFKIPTEKATEIFEQLDFREKGGYEMHKAMFFPDDDRENPFEVVVYIALPSNGNYLGHATAHAIARQIKNSKGPSGHNREYLLNLATALRHHGIVDEHVFEIESHLLQMIEDEEKNGNNDENENGNGNNNDKNREEVVSQVSIVAIDGENGEISSKTTIIESKAASLTQ